MQFGILGSGSWATALAKILTDNGHRINWWVRNNDIIKHIRLRRHNPHYLSTAYFDNNLLQLSDNVDEVVASSDVIVLTVPSAYITDALKNVNPALLKGKKIVSAVKGILPDANLLLNEYLAASFGVEMKDYFAVMGPCHAEEVAAEKLSYLTFSGWDEEKTAEIAAHFQSEYINVKVNHDIIGVQYAAVLKNIYALGAGIAHGLDYGDNFLSVYIANAANEMTVFLQKLIEKHIDPETAPINYSTSVYLGDLLVTCYSLHSRNRMFGNMIGKGYSVKAAILELNMVAEGYNASKCIYKTNQQVQAEIPIARTIYEILWEQKTAEEGFKQIEQLLV